MGSMAAHAGWGENTWAGTYWTNDAEITSLAVPPAESKYVVASNSYSIQAGESANTIIDSLVIDEDNTLTLAYNNGNKKNLTLEVAYLEMHEGANLVVGSGQTLTVTNASGLNAVTVDGTLNLNRNISTLHDLTFGESGQIQGVYNIGTKKTTLSITLSAADAVAAAKEGGFYTQSLISGEVWNAEKITDAVVSVTGADYANGGLLYLQDGIYYNTATFSNNTWTMGTQAELMANAAYLVVGTTQGEGNWNVSLSALVTPEPATATLSLLALAGLAARRRRH